LIDPDRACGKSHFIKNEPSRSTASQPIHDLIVYGATGAVVANREPEPWELPAMSSRYGAPSRAYSLLDCLRKHVHDLLEHDTPSGDIVIATMDEVRRRLPAIAETDAERIAEFIIEEVYETRLRPRDQYFTEDGCQVIMFPRRRDRQS
jgi:hypothetical protein